MKKIFTLTGLLLLAAFSVNAQAPRTGLDATEQQVVDHVNAHVEEAIGVLEEVVNINSGSLNVAGVRAVGEAFRPHFEAIGFKVRWEYYPEEMARGGNFYAERLCEEDCRGRRLLLIGHLDTVFEPDHPFQAFERDGNVARGPGINDMKGGDVAILYALKALDAAGALEGTTVTVAFTGDEERVARPHSISRAGLVEVAKRSDVALGFETGSREQHENGKETQYATIARRSSSGWKLVVEGRQAHSSGIFSEGSGSGAIFEVARILNAFHEELRGERYLTFNAGMILGGTDVEHDPSTSRGNAAGKSNVIPQSAIVTGGVRTLTDEQLQRTRERMREIVGRHLPKTKATIEFRDGYPSMPPTDGNRELLEVLNGINRDLGAPLMEAFDPGRRGAADISFVAPHVDAGLAALGVFGRGAHSPDEDIDLESLPLVVQRTALLVYRLTR